MTYIRPVRFRRVPPIRRARAAAPSPARRVTPLAPPAVPCRRSRHSGPFRWRLLQKARWRPSVCEYLCDGYKYARGEKKREGKQCREKRLRTSRAVGRDTRVRSTLPRVAIRSRQGNASASSSVVVIPVVVVVAAKSERRAKPPEGG